MGAGILKKEKSPVLARARFFCQSIRVMILNKRIEADLSFHSIIVWNVPSKTLKNRWSVLISNVDYFTN